MFKSLLRKTMKTKKTNIKELSRFLRESIIKEDKALNEARKMFLDCYYSQFLSESVIYRQPGVDGYAEYAGITEKDWNKIHKDLCAKYWPGVDPATRPEVTSRNKELADKFYKDFDIAVEKIQTARHVTLPSPDELAKAQQTAQQAFLKQTTQDYPGITNQEYNEVVAELTKQYGCEGKIPTGKKGAEFQKELDAKLCDLQQEKGIPLTAKQIERSQQLSDINAELHKTWKDRARERLQGGWDWVKKYAKVAGIATLVLASLFLIIYGIRQAVEMIRSIRKSKRELRDGTQVMMTIPFKNNAQMTKFFDIVDRKMSRYVEIESIEGNNVTISCDQEYVLKHIGEIKSAINEIKAEEKAQTQELAAESVSNTISFNELKRLVNEDRLGITRPLNAGCRVRQDSDGFVVIDPYGRQIGHARTEIEAEVIADRWSSMHELDEKVKG